MLALTTACESELSPGKYGQFRFVGQVNGAVPLDVFPPISDRSGNVYTLYGALNLPQVGVFVSNAAGGSIGGCTLTRGDSFGAHGWVGFGTSQAWYWSGDILVSVTAPQQMTRSGVPCTAVLPYDPSTNVMLNFRAVLPWVKLTPSRSTLVAFVQGESDPLPFTALVDLGVPTLTNVTAFTPSDATDVTFVGVGADPSNNTGFVLLTYQRNGSATTEGRFYDDGGNVVATAPMNGSPVTDAYAVQGYLQVNAHGRVVGLLSGGSLVTFDRSGGSIVPIDPSIEAVGVHRWHDRLWLVGTSGGKPVIAPIGDDGNPAQAMEWTTSEIAAQTLGGSLSVIDDRGLVPQSVAWSNVTTAIGAFPFLSPQSPWPQSSETTLWVAAGPSFQSSGAPATEIAIGPVGIRYP